MTTCFSSIEDLDDGKPLLLFFLALSRQPLFRPASDPRLFLPLVQTDFFPCHSVAVNQIIEAQRQEQRAEGMQIAAATPGNLNE